MGWLVKAFTGEPFGDKFHGHLVATSQREKLHQHTRMQMFDENGGGRIKEVKSLISIQDSVGCCLLLFCSENKVNFPAVTR